MEQNSFKMKALRIMVNEHRLIMHEMNEWFNPVREMSPELDKSHSELQAIMDKVMISREIIFNHTLKEELYFFEMLGVYIGKEQGPLLSIQEEHSEITHYFEQAMEEYNDGRPLGTFINHLQEAYEVAFMHMYKEEGVLFPMAEQQFKIVDEEKLLEQLNSNILPSK